jgi:hypothetical protein
MALSTHPLPQGMSLFEPLILQALEVALKIILPLLPGLGSSSVAREGAHDGRALTTTYQKRWRVEVFHKSVKQNAALAKSPTRHGRTQRNHCFAAIYSVFKLECLKLKHQLNHFALRGKLYMRVLQASF